MKTLQQKIETEKSAILAFMADGIKHSFRDIYESTGISKATLERRLPALVGKVDYLGRNGIGKETMSYYRIVPQPGIVPEKMADFPSEYLRWGGWTT